MTGYQYGELFRTWFEVFFCGGEVEEDVQEHLRSTLEDIPGNRVASPDTLLRTYAGEFKQYLSCVMQRSPVL